MKLFTKKIVGSVIAAIVAFFVLVQIVQASIFFDPTLGQLRDDFGVNPSALGDVTSSAVITDHAIVRGDGGAKGIQDSGIIIDDSNNVTGIVNLTASGLLTVGGISIPGTVASAVINQFIAVNDGNPAINQGSTAANQGTIQAIYDSGLQTLNYYLFSTVSDTEGDIVLSPASTFVGINNTSPAVALDVTGAITSSAGIIGTSFSTTNTTYGDRSIVSATGGVFNIALSAVSGDNFTVDGDKLVVLGDSGNVGIGTASPDGTLHVANGSAGTITPGAGGDDFIIEANTAAVGMSILAADSAQSNLVFGSPTNPVGALARWVHDDNLFRIITNNTGAEISFETNVADEAMRIDSAGNVGIGTNSPSNLFDVFESTVLGTVVGDRNEIATLRANHGSTGAARLDFYQYRNFAATGHESSDYRIQRNVGATPMSYISFKGSTGTGSRGFEIGSNVTPQLTVNADGDVGIGTVSPDTLLHALISGTAITGSGVEVIGILQKNGSAGNSAAISMVSGNIGKASLYLGDSDNPSIARISYNNNANDMEIWTNNAERVTIDSSGMVGIGITPTTALHVDSNAGNGIAITTFKNNNGDIDIFRVDATPEGSVTGSIGDLAVDGTNGILYIKTSGTATNTGWSVQGNPTSLSSLWVNGASVQTVIANQSEFVEIDHFVNLGEEDDNSNSVGSTANDNITIGAGGAGDYMIHQQASTKMDSGTNLEILVVPKITLATPKTITDATNATPIVVTTSAPHLLKTGDYVTQSGVVGNTAANGDFYVTFLTSTTYSLQAIDTIYSDVAGNGAYVSDGTVDAEYPGNATEPVSRSSSLFGRGAATGTHDLFVGDVISLCALNRSNANEIDFTQIQLGIERIEIE